MTIKEIATSRADVFHIPLSFCEIVPEFNIRYDLGSIDELAHSIRQNGVQQPLTGHKTNKDKFAITDGHRRIAACQLAVKQLEKEIQAARSRDDKAKAKQLKEELERCSSVPVMSEPKTKTEADRNFDIFTRNDGKPLTLLEEALLFRRLMKKHLVSEAEIVRRTGRSKTHMANCTLLLDGSAEELLDAVKHGKIAATLAIEMVRKQSDKTEQARMVKEAVARAEESGRAQATAKHLNESDRNKVAPSKRIPRGGGGGGGGGSDSGSSASTSSKPAVRKVGKTQTSALDMPKGCGVEARVLLAPVHNEHGDDLGFAFGVQLKYDPATKFTGTEPEANGTAYPTAAECHHESLLTVQDHLLAAKRSAGKGSKVQWDAAIDAVKAAVKAAADAVQRAKKAESKEHDTAETITPGATGNPTQHIIALRDTFKEDKRSKKSLGSDRYKTLNFVADYLNGGRYAPDQFEKFFTEFLLGRDR